MYIVYGNKHCLQCKIVEEAFKRKGIHYKKLDVSDNVIVQEKAKAKGIKTLPIVVNENTLEIVDPWKVLREC